jgi:hypothetical protein
LEIIFACFVHDELEPIVIPILLNLTFHRIADADFLRLLAVVVRLDLGFDLSPGGRKKKQGNQNG